VRSAASLASTASVLAGIAAEADRGGPSTPGPAPGPDSWETSNLLHVGQLLTEVAARREETRGGHVRADFPECDDARFRGHLRASRGAGGDVTTSYTPVLPAEADLLGALPPARP
jgi:L-aspartate oxidase